MKKYLRNFWKDERGGEMTETGINYGLIAVIVAVVASITVIVVKALTQAKDKIEKSLNSGNSISGSDMSPDADVGIDGTGDIIEYTEDFGE